MVFKERRFTNLGTLVDVWSHGVPTSLDTVYVHVHTAVTHDISLCTVNRLTTADVSGRPTACIS